VRLGDPGQCADGSRVFVGDGYEFTDSFGQLTHLPGQFSYLAVVRFTRLHQKLDSLVYRHPAFILRRCQNTLDRGWLSEPSSFRRSELNRSGNRRGFNGDHRSRLLTQTLTLIHPPVRFGQQILGILAVVGISRHAHAHR
jgi:hypothetical protein